MATLGQGVFQVSRGASGYQIKVTNNPMVVDCNSSGKPVGSLPSTTVSLWNDWVSVAYTDVAWTITPAGCTLINTTGLLQVTAITADLPAILVRAVYKGVTTEVVINVTKNRAGVDGKDTVTLELTPSASSAHGMLDGTVLPEAVSCGVLLKLGDQREKVRIRGNLAPGAAGWENGNASTSTLAGKTWDNIKVQTGLSTRIRTINPIVVDGKAIVQFNNTASTGYGVYVYEFDKDLKCINITSAYKIVYVNVDCYAIGIVALLQSAANISPAVDVTTSKLSLEVFQLDQLEYKGRNLVQRYITTPVSSSITNYNKGDNGRKISYTVDTAIVNLNQSIAYIPGGLFGKKIRISYKLTLSNVVRHNDSLGRFAVQFGDGYSYQGIQTLVGTSASNTVIFVDTMLTLGAKYTGTGGSYNLYARHDYIKADAVIEDLLIELCEDDHPKSAWSLAPESYVIRRNNVAYTADTPISLLTAANQVDHTFKLRRPDDSDTDVALDEYTIPFLSDGASAYQLDLTNDSDTVACDMYGKPLDVLPSTELKLYQGATLLGYNSAGLSWAFTADGLTYVNTVGLLQVATLTKDRAWIKAEAKIGGKVVGTATYTVTKVKAGADGEPPVMISVEPSTTVVGKDKTGAFTPASVNAVPVLLVGTGRESLYAPSVFSATTPISAFGVVISNRTANEFRINSTGLGGYAEIDTSLFASNGWYRLTFSANVQSGTPTGMRIEIGNGDPVTFELSVSRPYYLSYLKTDVSDPIRIYVSGDGVLRLYNIVVARMYEIAYPKRNLIKNSSLSVDTSGFSITSSSGSMSIVDCGEEGIPAPPNGRTKVCRFTLFADKTSGGVAVAPYLKRNTTYTFSAWVYSPRKVGSSAIGTSTVYYSPTGWQPLPSKVKTAVFGDWCLTSATFTTNNTFSACPIYISLNGLTTSDKPPLYISEYCLNEGENAQAWLAAPEDVALTLNDAAYSAGSAVNPGTYASVGMRFKASLGSLEDVEFVPVVTDGQDGKDGKYIVSEYKLGSTQPTGAGATVPPSVPDGQYLWMRTGEVTPPATAPTEWSVYVRISGEQGGMGEDGKKQPYYDYSFGYSTALTSGNSSTPPSPTPTWVDTPPTAVAGQYLWMRTKYFTVTAQNEWTTTPVVTYSRIGGQDGRGISSVQEYYLASASASGVTTATSGWQTSMPSMTATNKYLWNYEKITYTDGTTYSTAPAIIGTLSSDGRGISSITEYYLASASASGVTTATPGWQTTMPTLTPTNKYLWNYEVVYYTTGSPSYITPVIIGVYGDTGVPGTPGLNTATVKLYQRTLTKPTPPVLNTTFTFATLLLSGPLGSWTQTIPERNGMSLWVTFATAASSTSTDMILASEWSDPAVDPTDGTDGRDVVILDLVPNTTKVVKSPEDVFSPSFISCARRLKVGLDVELLDEENIFDGTIGFIIVSGNGSVNRIAATTFDLLSSDAGATTFRMVPVFTKNGRYKMSFEYWTDSLVDKMHIDVNDSDFVKELPPRASWTKFELEFEVSSYSKNPFVYNFIDFEKADWATYHFRDFKVVPFNRSLYLGRNLVIGASTGAGWTAGAWQGNNEFKMTKAATGETGYIYSDYFVVPGGVDLIISFDSKEDAAINSRDCYLLSDHNGNSAQITWAKSTEYTQVKRVIKTPAAWGKGEAVRLRFDHNGSTSAAPATIYVKNVYLGLSDSGFSPAPEDSKITWNGAPYTPLAKYPCASDLFEDTDSVWKLNWGGVEVDRQSVVFAPDVVKYDYLKDAFANGSSTQVGGVLLNNFVGVRSLGSDAITGCLNGDASPASASDLPLLAAGIPQDHNGVPDNNNVNVVARSKRAKFRVEKDGGGVHMEKATIGNATLANGDLHLSSGGDVMGVSGSKCQEYLNSMGSSSRQVPYRDFNSTSSPNPLAGLVCDGVRGYYKQAFLLTGMDKAMVGNVTISTSGVHVVYITLAGVTSLVGIDLAVYVGGVNIIRLSSRNLNNGQHSFNIPTQSLPLTGYDGGKEVTYEVELIVPNPTGNGARVSRIYNTSGSYVSISAAQKYSVVGSDGVIIKSTNGEGGGDPDRFQCTENVGNGKRLDMEFSGRQHYKSGIPWLSLMGRISFTYYFNPGQVCGVHASSCVIAQKSGDAKTVVVKIPYVSGTIPMPFVTLFRDSGSVSVMTYCDDTNHGGYYEIEFTASQNDYSYYFSIYLCNTSRD